MSALDVSSLRSTIRGPVFAPGDAGYDEARIVFNAAIDNHPHAIVRAADEADIATAVRTAREAGCSVSVRGGGHGVVGLATAGELVIDMSGMRGVTVDAAGRTVTAQGGATWVDVDTATQEHGLATPGGRVTHTGIGGFTLGGGQGWLSPLHGLTIDNLLEATLVTADGSVVTAGPAGDPELLWGLKGGGGGLGVVTSFTYRLHPVGPMIYGGLLVHPLDRAKDLVAKFLELDAKAPREFGGAMVFASAPPAPFVPPEAVGAPVVLVVLPWFGDHAEGERVLADFRSFGPPIVDLVGPMPYLTLQSMIDEGNPFGLRHYWSAGYTKALDPALVDVIIEAASTRLSPLAQIIVSPIGGAVNDVGEEDTAFGHRDAKWFIHPLAVYTDPAEDAVQKAWVKQTMERVAPYESGGTYLNLSSELDSSRARTAYGDQTYKRLATLKATYDPENLFPHSTAIAPE